MKPNSERAFYYGSTNALSKLTESQVLKMRSEYRKGNISMRSLMKKYPVSYTTIRGIIKRIYWKHI